MEVIESISGLVDKIKSYGSNFLNEIIPFINKLDVYFNYEKDKNGNIIRLILRIRKNNNIHPLIYYYCNGTVIDTVKWRIMSVPPIAFNKRQTPDLIETYYNQGLYDVLKVIDGTVVTIYYWNCKWNISTSNSYDVSEFYWIGDLNYSEIIYDLFIKLHPKVAETIGIELIDNRLNFTELRKKIIYNWI